MAKIGFEYIVAAKLDYRGVCKQSNSKVYGSESNWSGSKCKL